MATEPGSKVLLTGAQGFTGRYVAQALAIAGYQVIGLDSGPAVQADYFQADLTDAAQLLQVIERITPQAVIHLAGIAFVAHGDSNAFYQVNLQGTRNLLEALSRTNSGQEGVVLASSANVYGNVSHGRPITEDSAPSPVNDYAVSKLAMEYMARLWFDRLPITITRPFNYTGVGQSQQFLIPKITGHFQRREKVIELGNLGVRREFNDVRFVAEVYAGLLKAKAWGETVNICTGITYSIEEVLTMCEELTGHKLQVKQNPDLMRAGEITELMGDAGKLDKIASWPKLDFQETIRWLIIGQQP